MSTVTFKGSPVTITGDMPALGSQAPDFVLTAADLSDVRLADLKGTKLLLNIFPSIDTEVCAASVRRFHEAASAQPNLILLAISADLPFAHKRFCAAEGIDRVRTLSTFRAPGFGADYGVLISSAPLAGLLTRAVLVLDPQHRVIYTQRVAEIAQEPDYAAALQACTAD